MKFLKVSNYRGDQSMSVVEMTLKECKAVVKGEKEFNKKHAGQKFMVYRSQNSYFKLEGEVKE